MKEHAVSQKRAKAAEEEYESQMASAQSSTSALEAALEDARNSKVEDAEMRAEALSSKLEALGLAARDICPAPERDAHSTA